MPAASTAPEVSALAEVPPLVAVPEVPARAAGSVVTAGAAVSGVPAVSAVRKRNTASSCDRAIVPCLTRSASAGVVGPFSPGQGAKYIKSGAIREGFIWNPMLAGEVIVYLGDQLAKGETPKDGMDIPGLGPVKVDAATRNIQAQKLQAINKETIDELVGMGL